MFIDYVALMLINMSAGFFLLACYVYRDTGDSAQKGWAPVFAAAGLPAFINGCVMIWTWPLPGSYNSTFGEMSVFLGILFLGAALAMAKEWDLSPLSIYAFFAGLAAVVVGAAIINLGLTQAPLISGAGFILSGMSGMAAFPFLRLRSIRAVRILAAAVLTGISILWAVTGYSAYWGHMKVFKDWPPARMHQLIKP